ncbi:AbrB/MazE/SpoVT family DNA-binding domain-containing protein [Bacillus sp. V59.32b]|nr:AbrB/MazE/SpoVT family DNA-binding domain-containing protein [Bacillus sp. V59.32b]
MTITGVKQVERKVTKVGNSLGVTFPAEVLEHLNVKQGDQVSFHFEQGAVKIEKARKVPLPKGIDNNFLDLMNDMINEYDETFKGLAKR